MKDRIILLPKSPVSSKTSLKGSECLELDVIGFFCPQWYLTSCQARFWYRLHHLKCSIYNPYAVFVLNPLMLISLVGDLMLELGLCVMDPEAIVQLFGHEPSNSSVTIASGGLKRH